MDKNKFCWGTRLKMCWAILFKGRLDSHYKTKHEEEQWRICERRRQELETTTRPRTEYPYSDEYLEQ
ncbi:hypothetical protein CL634_06455 [bacterium]|nr:hypothetical protein [bacterium]|tara:strand:+ start:2799 stop:2999 length:201 start_codon:yes stop_codon:yes gene_type:complete